MCVTLSPLLFTVILILYNNNNNNNLLRKPSINIFTNGLFEFLGCDHFFSFDKELMSRVNSYFIVTR